MENTIYNIQNPDFFVHRTPLLPFDNIKNIFDGNIESILDNPIVQEALFISSPEFYRVINQWRHGKIINNKNADRIEITVYKYLLRMSYRCTPFGLFAGISLGEVGETADLQLKKNTFYKSHARLDMEFLCMLIYEITKNKEIQKELYFFPNQTMYKIGEQLRLLECHNIQGKRQFKFINIEDNIYIDEIIKRSKKGMRFDELVQLLSNKDISLENAREFIQEIIDSQLLISELYASVTGENTLADLIKILHGKINCNSLFLRLSNIQQSIEEINKNYIGTNIKRYENLIGQIKQFEIPVKEQRLFFVDLVKPTLGSTLPSIVFDELKKGINFIAKITPPYENEILNTFKKKFIGRFQEQEIPLNIALDIESGIGYPVHDFSNHFFNPLLENISVSNTNDDVYVKWGGWQIYLLEKYHSIIKEKKLVMQLNEKEIEPYFTKSIPQLASSLYSVISVLSKSKQEIEKGNFEIFYQFTGGPSGASLLARFCNQDSNLNVKVNEHCRKEEGLQPDFVFAEIVHIGDAKSSNTSLRTQLRCYEIPIFAKPSVKKQNILFLDDIMVSVRNDRVVLRSLSLKKEIMPRLSSAHTYSKDLSPAYYFLCDMQFQNIHKGLGWDWPPFFKALGFLPRITYNKIIFSPAIWRIKANEIKKIRESPIDALEKTINSIRLRNNIPRMIVVTEGDNKLLLDLEKIIGMKMLRNLCEKSHEMIFEECLFNEKNLIIECEDGKYTNELIIPLFNKIEKGLPVPISFDNEPLITKRNFFIGGNWLYFKIYCGYKTADKILIQTIKPFCDKLEGNKYIDKWFFIRYNDPNNHLRIRFYSNNPFNLSKAIFDISQELDLLLERKLIYNIQLDTYSREIERYGKNTIELSESIFYIDSFTTIKFLGLIDDCIEKEDLRWLFGLKSVDVFLSCFEYTLLDKFKLLENLANMYINEHSSIDTKKELKVKLDYKYRANRDKINLYLQKSDSSINYLNEMLIILNDKTCRLKPLVNIIYECKQKNKLEIPLDNLVSSYIHMMLNRIFMTEQRANEMVIYYFLSLYYKSEIAKSRKSEILS